MKRLNRNGVPYVCVLITMAISCLSYLSVSAGVSDFCSLDMVLLRVWLISFA